MSIRIRTLIVDDEPLARQLIFSLLAGDKEIDVVARCTDGKSALKAVNKYRPDLMFLDVQMPGLSGFDLVQSITPERMPYIIFITAYDQYAVRAFEIHALDYLLKPFEKERFYASVNRAKAVLRHQAMPGLTDKIFKLASSYTGTTAATQAEPGIDGVKNRSEDSYLTEFIIRESGRLLAIKVETIEWLEAANQYVRIHTNTGSHLLSRSLDALQKQLDPDRFFRIHRSALVHAAYIKEVRSAKHATCDVLLASGKCLKLSRSRRHLLPLLLSCCS
jgi:two-component system LytT family response regulator